MLKCHYEGEKNMTNTNITIFNNADFGSVRTIVDEKGEPWFVAKDIAVILGISNIRQNLDSLDEDETGVCKTYIRSENGVEQEREVRTVNESGLYTLVVRSNKPNAKKFRKWVTSEVLPTIRKTGSYSIQTTPIDTIVFSSDPLERCKALTLVLEEERAKKALIEQQKEQAITERAMMQEAFSRAIVSDKDVGYTDFITRLKMTTQCACSLLKELNIFGKKGPLADFGEWFKTEPNKDGFPARFVTPLGQEKLIGLFNNNRDKMIAVNGTYRYLQPKNRVKQITLLSQS